VTEVIMPNPVDETRAVSGFAGLATQSANRRRRSLSGASGASPRSAPGCATAESAPAVTCSRGLSGSPRWRMNVAPGLSGLAA
jgi:hypothetical protein